VLNAYTKILSYTTGPLPRSDNPDTFVAIDHLPSIRSTVATSPKDPTMSSRILQDAGILELLNCLRSSNASDSNEQDEASPNANCPEQVIRDTWNRLRDA
jgi:hypothetical protein